MLNRAKPLIAMIAAASVAWAGLAPLAVAHHGWNWAEAENSEITGTVEKVQLGNPHGEVTILVGGERWTVEVGQPWRNERAGLTPELLKAGVSITAQGHRSRDKNEKLFKAERLLIDGKPYNLYPDRD
jgi:hypothetical protein